MRIMLGDASSLVNWQSSKEGSVLFRLEQAYLRQLIQMHSPDRVLQISGHPLLMHKEVFHYVLMQERSEYSHAPVPTLQGDIDGRLPFRDETFKMIVLVHTHERSDQTALLIKEIERILMPEGLVVFFGIAQTSLWSMARLFKLYYTPSCRRIYSDFTLRAMIKQMGLTCVHTPYFHLEGSRFSMARNAFHVVMAKKSVSGWVLGMPLMD